MLTFFDIELYRLWLHKWDIDIKILLKHIGVQIHIRNKSPCSREIWIIVENVILLHYFFENHLSSPFSLLHNEPQFSNHTMGLWEI